MSAHGNKASHLDNSVGNGYATWNDPIIVDPSWHNGQTVGQADQAATMTNEDLASHLIDEDLSDAWRGIVSAELVKREEEYVADQQAEVCVEMLKRCKEASERASWLVSGNTRKTVISALGTRR